MRVFTEVCTWVEGCERESATHGLLGRVELAVFHCQYLC